MLLTKLKNVVSSIGSELGSFAKENPILTGATLVAATGGTVALISTIKKRRKKKSGKRKTKKKARRTKKKKGKKRRIRYTPRTAGKGKDTSTRRIRQTKHGQPYIILKSGKARFIKKSSARLSRKRKGGRY